MKKIILPTILSLFSFNLMAEPIAVTDLTLPTSAQNGYITISNPNVIAVAFGIPDGGSPYIVEGEAATGLKVDFSNSSKVSHPCMTSDTYTLLAAGQSCNLPIERTEGAKPPKAGVYTLNIPYALFWLVYGATDKITVEKP